MSAPFRNANFPELAVLATIHGTSSLTGKVQLSSSCYRLDLQVAHVFGDTALLNVSKQVREHACTVIKLQFPVFRVAHFEHSPHPPCEQLDLLASQYTTSPRTAAEKSIGNTLDCHMEVGVSRDMVSSKFRY